MATKSNLITSINTQITAIVTIVKHRLSMLEVVNELFPTTDNYVLATGDHQYNLHFTKSGNFCHVQGFIKNGAAVAVNGENFFTIPNSIYYPKITTYTLGFLDGSADGKRLYFGQASDPFAPNQIRLMNGIGAGDIVRINTTYIVND